MKTLVFDMYGVIMKDPEGGLMPFINRVFPDLTYDDVYYPHWIDACTGGLSSLDFFKNIGFRGDMERIEKEYLDTIEIDPAFYHAVLALRRSFRFALLTNDLSEWSKYLRDKFKINDYFDVIIVSGDVKIRKPDARIYQLILDKLQQPARDCIYIDDRVVNLATAESIGMEAVLFNNSIQYNGKTVHSFDDLVRMLTSRSA